MDGIQNQKIVVHDHHRHQPNLKTEKVSFVTQICFRVLATAATVAATWIVLTSKQTVVVFGLVVDARYNYSSAFKFFAYTNLIVCAFSAVSAFILFIIGHKSFSVKKYFCLFVSDLVITTLLMAACAAATSFGYIGQHGNDHAGWAAICDHFHKFCGRISISMGLSYFCVALYLILTIMSANSSRKI